MRHCATVLDFNSMENFFFTHQSELLSSLITVIILLITRILSIKAIRKVGRLSAMDSVRTRLIIKYVIIGHSLLLVAALAFIWGINIRDLGLIVSSVFAVLGVALFASWSILSNVTAGVILFFSFPYKIGDRIRIQDKELEEGSEFIIEDIRAFHVHLRKPNRELVTYPNSLFLLKAVTLMHTEEDPSVTTEESEVLKKF